MITSFLVHVHGNFCTVCVEILWGENFHKFHHIPALIGEKFITQFFVLYVLVIIHVPIENNTVNHEYFDVKIFSDSMACAKIKHTKYMRDINDNAV